MTSSLESMPQRGTTRRRKTNGSTCASRLLVTESVRLDCDAGLVRFVAHVGRVFVDFASLRLCVKKNNIERKVAKAQGRKESQASCESRCALSSRAPQRAQNIDLLKQEVSRLASSADVRSRTKGPIVPSAWAKAISVGPGNEIGERCPRANGPVIRLIQFLAVPGRRGGGHRIGW